MGVHRDVIHGMFNAKRLRIYANSPRDYLTLGSMNGVGEENAEDPKWLWDSYELRTVRAETNNLNQEYVAITYTWSC